MKSIIVFGVTLLLVVLFATGAGLTVRRSGGDGVRLLSSTPGTDFQILRSLGGRRGGRRYGGT